MCKSKRKVHVKKYTAQFLSCKDHSNLRGFESLICSTYIYDTDEMMDIIHIITVAIVHDSINFVKIKISILHLQSRAKVCLKMAAPSLVNVINNWTQMTKIYWTNCIILSFDYTELRNRHDRSVVSNGRRETKETEPLISHLIVPFVSPSHLSPMFLYFPSTNIFPLLLRGFQPLSNLIPLPHNDVLGNSTADTGSRSPSAAEY